MRNKKNILFLIFAMSALFFSGCKEEWDSHFYSGLSVKSNKSLFDCIKATDTLSVFAKMIKITGYDSILNKPQTFTVWAPVNNDSLKRILNSNDTAEIKRVVENHIAYFSYPTSHVDSTTIAMVDKKKIFFTLRGGNYFFGNEKLIKGNIAANNGVLHYILGYVPYRSTFWEYVRMPGSGLDSLRNFFLANDTIFFNKEASKQISVDANNRPVYDSVFVKGNLILNTLASLDKEDSIYTTILPTNTAWAEAYNRIKLNYVTLTKDGGLSAQSKNTRWAIFQDAVFRTRINTQLIPGDSLVSTSKNVFHSPTYLFDNSKKLEMSNGNAYLTDLLKFRANESWNFTIRIEAENSVYGRSNLNCDIYYKPLYGFGISNSRFVQLEPTTTSSVSKVSCIFPIPNTLSATYNLSCVFVPTNFVSPGDLRPSKVRFYLTYLDATGKEVSNVPIVTVNNVNQLQPGKTATIFITDPVNLTKMPVIQFQFPICNLYTSKSLPANVYVKLKVENATATTETTLFNRTMRIDCILLEPVVKN